MFLYLHLNKYSLEHHNAVFYILRYLKIIHAYITRKILHITLLYKFAKLFIAKLAPAAKVIVTYLFSKYITSSTCRNSSYGDLPENFQQRETKKTRC